MNHRAASWLLAIGVSRRRRCLPALVLAAVLSGCGSSPPPAVVTIPPPAGEPPGTPAPPPPPLRTDCETSTDPAAFASADALWALEQKLDSYGLRATGNPSHQAYVAWLEAQLRAIPGIEMRTVDYPIQRWTQTGIGLEAGPVLGLLLPVPVSGAVPYALPTPADGVQAPLVYVPAGTAISAANATGKLVLRDIVPGSVPNAVFTALEWWTYDPEQVLTQTIAGSYERDWLSSNVPDIEAAAAAGAAGVIFLHGLPRTQVQDQYRPYEGLQWPVPALYVGADEAEQLKALAAVGGLARLKLTAVIEPASTRMLVATLPGASEESLLIESHTDGTNALWDNGPLAMLEMARYFGQFVPACRARTLRFVFSTAHLYQHLVTPWRDGSAEQYAQEYDREYQDGTGVAVVVIEHLGARSYTAVPRSDGGPGRELVLTGGQEPNSFFVSESAGLQAALLQAVIGRDLRQTIALRGADLPGAHFPLHHSFGGEGNPYILHLLPTIGFIVAPWTLFTPGYSLEGIDKDLMHRQALVFTDLIYKLSVLPRETLAGAVTAQRAARDELCASGEDVSAYVRCEGSPSARGANP